MRLADFELEHYFERYEFSTPFLLSSSDVEPVALADLLATADSEMRALWEQLHLGYTEVRGHPLLRAEIASLYDGLDPDDVVVFCGAQEPIFAAMNVCLGPGDHAVVVTPSYQSLAEVGRAAGAHVTTLPLDERREWALDLDGLRASVRANTRLIVLNAPNSPTGSLPARHELSAVFEIAGAVGARVFVDEVYRFLEFDDRDRLPAAAEVAPNGISLGVLSKAFGLAGLRIGWLASRDRAWLDDVVAFKHYLTICSAGPSEVLATMALRARGALLERSCDLIRRNVAILEAAFRSDTIFRWTSPRAGTVGLVEFVSEVPIETFAAQLADAEGVMILPASVFDWPGNSFRVGFGRANLEESLGRLVRFSKQQVSRA